MLSLLFTTGKRTTLRAVEKLAKLPYRSLALAYRYLRYFGMVHAALRSGKGSRRKYGRTLPPLERKPFLWRFGVLDVDPDLP